MTIHQLFTQEEQDLINEGLEKLRRQAKSQAESPIRGHGRASEYATKDKWRTRLEIIEDLQNKIVELSI